MKFTVNREEAQKIANIALKMVGKFLHGCLVSDGNELRIVINSDNYVNLLIPSAKVEGKGIVALQSEVFSQLFSLRGKVIKAELDTKQNKLNVECGSKVSFYIIALKQDDVQPPKVSKSDKLKLTAKTSGFLKTMLNVARYESPDIDVTDYALLENSKEGFNILCCSTNSFAIYQHKTPISKEKFSITVPVSLFRMAFELCSSEVEIYVTDNLLFISSDNFIVTFPSLQENLEDKTKAAFNFLLKASFKKGKVVFNSQTLFNVLKSIRTISGGKDTIQFSIKDKKIFLQLESMYGKSKDACPASENTLGNVTVEMSELFLNSTLNIANGVSKSVTLSLEKDLKFYQLESATEEYSVKCFGPLFNSKG